MLICSLGGKLILKLSKAILLQFIAVSILAELITLNCLWYLEFTLTVFSTAQSKLLFWEDHIISQAVAYSPIYTSFLGSIVPGPRQAFVYSPIYTSFLGSIVPGRE